MSQLRNPLTTRCLNSSDSNCGTVTESEKGKRGNTRWDSKGATSNCSACCVVSGLHPSNSRRETLQQGWFFNQTVNCFYDLLQLATTQKKARSEWAIGQLFSRHTTDLSRSLSLSVSFAGTLSRNKMPPQAKLLIISHSAFAERWEVERWGTRLSH